MAALNIGVVDGYDRWAATYDKTDNPLIAVEERAVLAMLGDVHGLRVLDLGCGTGRYTVLLARRGATVTGVDLSLGMLAQAILKQAGVPFALVRGTLCDLCFPDGWFNVVLCALALNHVRPLRRVLAEAARVLRVGGTMVISDFHPYWLVFDRGHTEFLDEGGQEYWIDCTPHLLEDYWAAFTALGLQLEALHEPKVTASLVEGFPNMGKYLGLPLALIMCLRRE